METQYDVVEKDAIKRALDKVCMKPIGAVGVLILIILPAIPPLNADYLVRWYILAAIMGGAAVAFDFSGGYIAVVNFGYAAFLGLGAYTSAIICNSTGIPPIIGWFLGAFSAGLLGFLTGIVSLRMRGMFAICLTWFVGIALMGLVIKLVDLTRGTLGLSSAFLFGPDAPNLYYWYIILFMSLATYVILRKMTLSHMGLAFKAIGQNMDAAKTSGINPTRYRIINFTLSCAFGGWLGGFYANFFGILTPDLLHTIKTVEILVICYLGGRGSLWGGLAFAFPFIYGTEMLRSNFEYLPGINLLIYGIFMMLVMIFYGGGMAQLYRDLADKFAHNSTIRWLTT